MANVFLSVEVWLERKNRRFRNWARDDCQQHTSCLAKLPPLRLKARSLSQVLAGLKVARVCNGFVVAALLRYFPILEHGSPGPPPS
jgi:hypothetical protein